MKSASRRHWEELSWLPAIRSPDEWRPSDRLCISCTQTELPAAQQRKLAESWCEVLPTLAGVRVLQFDSLVPQELFDAACRMKKLESLWIKHSRVKHLDPLLDCRSLRHLYLGNSAQTESIDPLAGMARLKSLYLGARWDCKSLRPGRPVRGSSYKKLRPGLRVGGNQMKFRLPQNDKSSAIAAPQSPMHRWFSTIGTAAALGGCH